jgi:hypothetical protein
VPKLYNENQLPLREILEMAVREEVDVKWPPACEDVSLGAEKWLLLEDVTKQSSEDRA